MTAVVVIPVMIMTFIVKYLAGVAVNLIFIFVFRSAELQLVAVHTVVAILLDRGEGYIESRKSAVLKRNKLCFIDSDVAAGIGGGRRFSFFSLILS